MFKKNLWIVALLTALSFTAFMTTSCVDPALVDDAGALTYVDIGTTFNTWGGQNYQSGWSTDGASWNDPDHTVKNLGLQLDDFKSARYLEIEINGDSLAGALDVIWGNESNGWNQTNSVAPGGASGPLKIDLTKLKDYPKYAASTSQIRIILQYNQPGQVAGLVKSARLGIPEGGIIILPPCDNPECRDPDCVLGKGICKNTVDKIYTYEQDLDYNSETAPISFNINLNDWKTPGANDPKLTPVVTYPGFNATNASTTETQVTTNLTQEKSRLDAIADAEKALASAEKKLAAAKTDAEKATAQSDVNSAKSGLAALKSSLQTFYDGFNVASVKASFEKYNQTLNFKLTDQQANFLRAAGSIKVEIKGSVKANPGDAVDRVTRNLTYFVGDALGTDNWNAWNAPSSSGFSTGFGTDIEFDFTNDGTGAKDLASQNLGKSDNFKYFIIRQRPARQSPESGNVDAKTDLIIESIRFTVSDIAVTDALAITLTAPVTGGIAQTSVDVKSGTTTIGKGAVTWVPAPLNGVFGPRTVYYANIAITPNAGVIISSEPTVQVNGNASNVSAYAPSTKTVTTKDFTATTTEKVGTISGGDFDDVPNAEFTQTAGSTILWNMATWIDGRTTIASPVQKSGGANVDVVGTGINVTNRNQNWDCVDFNMSDIGLDPSKDKIRVTVAGYALGSWDGSAKMQIQGNAGAYITLAQTAAAVSGTDEPFILTAEIPQGYISNGQNSVRVNTDQATASTYRVTLVVFEKVGTQAACTCAKTANHDANACIPCSLEQICTCTSCTTCNPKSSGTAGKYSIPTGGAGEFYLDLGKLSNAGNSPRPNQAYTANSTTFFFNNKAQRVAIALSSEASAAVRQAYSSSTAVYVMVNGTNTGTVKGAGSNMRFILGDATSKAEYGWSGSKWFTGATAAKLDQDTVNASVVKNTDYLIIDAAAITKNTKLVADSIIIKIGSMPPAVVNAPANGTLFVPGTSASAAWGGASAKYTYDSKEYWAFHRHGSGVTGSAYSALTEVAGWLSTNSAADFTDAQIGTDALARLEFIIPADIMALMSLYSTMKITYDYINIGSGDMVMMVRAYNSSGNNNIGPSGNNVTFENGTDKVATFDATRIGDRPAINIIHNAVGNYSLFRITSISFE